MKPVWATLTKISASGFFAETPSPLPIDTCANVTLRTLVGEIRAGGITRSSLPESGMGIAFIHLEEQDRLRLDRFIEHVVKSNDATMNLGVAMIEPLERAAPPPSTPQVDGRFA